METTNLFSLVSQELSLEKSQKPPLLIYKGILTKQIDALSKKQAIDEIENREALAGYERAVTLQNCLDSATVTQLIKVRNKSYALTLIIMIIQSFCNSLKLEKSLTVFEIMDFAKDYIDRYKHESVDDLVQAFKSSKQRGDVTYARFTTHDLNTILNSHFEQKAEYRERQARNQYKENETTEESKEKIRSIYKKMVTGQWGLERKASLEKEARPKAQSLVEYYEKNAEERKLREDSIQKWVNEQAEQLGVEIEENIQ